MALSFSLKNYSNFTKLMLSMHYFSRCYAYFVHTLCKTLHVSGICYADYKVYIRVICRHSTHFIQSIYKNYGPSTN